MPTMEAIKIKPKYDAELILMAAEIPPGPGWDDTKQYISSIIQECQDYSLTQRLLECMAAAFWDGRVVGVKWMLDKE